jgi:hypothetical protein
MPSGQTDIAKGVVALAADFYPVSLAGYGSFAICSGRRIDSTKFGFRVWILCKVVRYGLIGMSSSGRLAPSPRTVHSGFVAFSLFLTLHLDVPPDLGFVYADIDQLTWMNGLSTSARSSGLAAIRI